MTKVAATKAAVIEPGPDGILHGTRRGVLMHVRRWNPAIGHLCLGIKEFAKIFRRFFWLARRVLDPRKKILWLVM